MSTEGASAQAGGALGVRQDPTGEVRAALGQLIAEGSAIASELLYAEGGQLGGHLDSILGWRIGCVALVRSAFEQEAALELVRATSSASRAARGSVLGMHRARIEDALELLKALEGTLNRRGGRGEHRAEPRERRPARA